MVWLTQAQMVELFGSIKANISGHITNIYQKGELVQSATVRKFRTVRKEGNPSPCKRYTITFFKKHLVVSLKKYIFAHTV